MSRMHLGSDVARAADRACELLVSDGQRDLVFPLMRELLRSGNAVVRESAVLNLGEHCEDDDALALLESVAADDTSSAVRDAARDSADNWRDTRRS